MTVFLQLRHKTNAVVAFEGWIEYVFSEDEWFYVVLFEIESVAEVESC